MLGVIHDGGGTFVRSQTRDCLRLLGPLGGLVGICLLCFAIVANAAWATEYTVTSTGDQVDEAVGSGGCKTTLGTCTLRAAIEESNASAGVEDTVKFAESFDGHVADTIKLGATLPTITDRVRLRGYPMPQKCETDYYSFPGPCVGSKVQPAERRFGSPPNGSSLSGSRFRARKRRWKPSTHPAWKSGTTGSA